MIQQKCKFHASCAYKPFISQENNDVSIFKREIITPYVIGYIYDFCLGGGGVSVKFQNKKILERES